MKVKVKYYVATSLLNIDAQRQAVAELDSIGWNLTYDWTVHGSVAAESKEDMIRIAKAEVNGVKAAEVIVILLPGGRGTHVELGIGLGMGKRIVMIGESDKFCLFHEHPSIERYDNISEFVVIQERAIKRS